jgi:P4 family phage/plasmid primase-like protien
VSNPSIPVRPGILEATLRKAGVRYCDFPEKDSIEIPYFNLRAEPIGFSRYRLPIPRANGQKYHQAAGSAVHVYFAPLPQSANGPFPPKSLGIVEGEFKDLSLAEEGWPVIGLPSFITYQRDKNDIPHLLTDLATAFKAFSPQTVFFVGDNDTTTNFEFSRQCVFLSQAIVPARLYLPRIPITSPKGVDDCKEALGSQFQKFFSDLINGSIELDPKLSTIALAILLIEREKPELAKLTGLTRERHFERLIELCVAARQAISGNYAELTRLYELVGQIMGLTASKVEKTVKEKLQPKSKALTETDLVRLLRNELPPIKVWKGQWYRQTDYWESVDREIYQKTALDLIPEIQRTARLASQVLDHFQALQHLERDEFAGAYLFDGHDILLCVANGVLRIKPNGDATLEPFASKHLFTARLAARYDLGANCFHFESTLIQALPDPLDQELYLFWAASVLIPDCRFETALCCFGPGETSKSTLASGLSAALGSEATTVLKLTEICDSAGYHRPKLRRSMLNISTELDAVVLENSEDFKRLVSGEDVEAREIYGKPFKMRATTKFLFLCNQLPRFKFGTDAELRRLRFLRFNQKPKVKDTELKTKIAAEKDGILRLLVDYLGLLLAKGAIPAGSADSESLQDRFAQTNDPIGRFVSRHCSLDPKLSVLKDHLAKRFAAYVAQLGLPPSVANNFFKSLYDRYPTLKSARLWSGPKQPGKRRSRPYYVEGIALK